MVLAKKLKRPLALAAAAGLLVASALPLFSPQHASAYGLLGSRKVTMSSSADGSTAAGQGLIYQASFNVTQTAQIQGVVVEFCDNSPIIGDSCGVPATATDFVDLTGTTVDLETGSGGVLTGFVKDAATTGNRLVLTNASGHTPGTSTENIHFSFDSVDNPHTSNTTFYARILTFGTVAGATSYAPTVIGTPLDAGGVALSTAAQITVTSKVQERLTFCVYTTGTGNNCTTKSGTAVTLGDDNGVLSPTGPFVDKNAKYTVTTNASGSAVIHAKGGTLQTGSFTIDAIGTTAAASSAGTEQFGFCTYETASSAGTAITPQAPYDGGGNCGTTTQSAGTATSGGEGTATFAYDTASLNSTYGDHIATKTAGDWSTGTLAFVGNISNTTEAGIYATTLTFIATGTY